MNEYISCGAGANPYIRVCIALHCACSSVPGSQKRAKCSNLNCDFDKRTPKNSESWDRISRCFFSTCRDNILGLNLLLAAFNWKLRANQQGSERQEGFWCKHRFLYVPVKLERISARADVTRHAKYAVILTLGQTIYRFSRHIEAAVDQESRMGEGPLWCLWRQANKRVSSNCRVLLWQNVNRQSTWGCCQTETLLLTGRFICF